ncbi:MAG: hypothetical protein CMK32_00935 [Porticoccaceae bacterium]|nr:hypothetical protein [Porticoccaceae bacterium]
MGIAPPAATLADTPAVPALISWSEDNRPGAETELAAPGKFTTPVAVLSLAVLYFIAAKLGLLINIAPGFASPLWPAAGLALGALLSGGLRLWPGILIGYFLASPNLDMTADGIIIAFTSGAGSAIQALVGALLTRRLIDRQTLTIRDGEIPVFLFAGGVVATLIAPTIGVTTLFLSGEINGSEYFSQWLVRWVGDVLGVVFFAPITLLLWGSTSVSIKRALRISIPLLVTAALLLAGNMALLAVENGRYRAQSESRINALIDSTLVPVNEVLLTLDSASRFFSASESVSYDELSDYLRVLKTNPLVEAVQWLALDAPGSDSFSRRYALGENVIDLTDNPDMLSRAHSAGALNKTLIDAYARPDGATGLLALIPLYPDQGVFGGLLAAEINSERVKSLLNREIPGYDLTLQVTDARDIWVPLSGTDQKTQPQAHSWSHEVHTGDVRWRVNVRPQYRFGEGGTGLGANLYYALSLVAAMLVAQTVLSGVSRELAIARSEKSLRESRSRLAAILESPCDMILAVDNTLNVIACNRTFKQLIKGLTGCTPVSGSPLPTATDAKGRTFLDYLASNFRRAMAAESVTVSQPMDLAKENEGPVWIESTYSPVKDADGSIIGAVQILRDITDRKALEEQLSSQVEELERWRDATLGRENRVLELKQEINRLLEELGRPPRYHSATKDHRGA